MEEYPKRLYLERGVVTVKSAAEEAMWRESLGGDVEGREAQTTAPPEAPEPVSQPQKKRSKESRYA